MRLRRRQKFSLVQLSLVQLSLVQLSLVKLFLITSSFGRKLFTLFQLMGSTCEREDFTREKGFAQGLAG